MERDRGAALIKQAAYKGVIDFSKAKPSDRLWWLKLRWTLDELEKENVRYIQEMQFAQNIAVLNYLSDEKQFKHHWERALNLTTSIYNGLFPWNQQAEQQADLEKEYDGLVKQWKDTFGDPNDPEVAAKIKSTCDLLMKQGKK